MSTPPVRTTDNGLVVVGWREYVDLPQWNVEHIVAKADTGARSSAIDVANIEELPGGRVRFDLVIDRRQSGQRRTIEADITRRSRVKSSFGHMHDRLFVTTLVKVGPHEHEVELGLVSRRNMLCRMLLGRKFLQHGFVVDSRHTYIQGRRRRRSKKRASTGKDQSA